MVAELAFELPAAPPERAFELPDLQITAARGDQRHRRGDRRVFGLELFAQRLFEVLDALSSGEPAERVGGIFAPQFFDRHVAIGELDGRHREERARAAGCEAHAQEIDRAFVGDEDRAGHRADEAGSGRVGAGEVEEEVDAAVGEDGRRGPSRLRCGGGDRPKTGDVFGEIGGRRQLSIRRALAAHRAQGRARVGNLQARAVARRYVRGMVKINKSTPLLVVEDIESQLELWTKKLGYEKTVEVPHAAVLGFVILVRAESEVMLQTKASVDADFPAVGAHLKAGSMLIYNDVDSLEAAKAATAGLEVLVPERRTFYGAKEIFVRTRDGHVLGYAEHA